MTDEKFKKKNCRYCNTELPEPFLELGTMPLANSCVAKADAAKEEFTCPLSLVWCPKCALVQSSHVVPPDLMFKNYLYVSSTTKTFQDHFAEYARTVYSRLLRKENTVAVDIGSNDGLLLSKYKDQGMKIVGVDPATNLAEAANKNGIPTINRYFDAECVKIIRQDYGPADVVSANNVFAHIDDIASVCANVHALLSDQGIFTIEFPYLLTMMDELLFDMIYHEHLSYIAVNPLSFVLSRFNLEIFDIQRVSSHGGSLRVFIQKKGGPYPKAKIVGEMMADEKKRGCLEMDVYKKFAQDVHDTKKQFLELVTQIKSEGKTISGYGVPAKASTIINYYGLTKEDIDFAVDDNPLKQGLLVPGAKIPIVPSAYLKEHPTNYVIIFAWNFAKEILQKIGSLKENGVQFLVPVKGASEKNRAVFST